MLSSITAAKHFMNVNVFYLPWPMFKNLTLYTEQY